MVEQIRGRLLAPEARKISPLYSSAQVAALCGVDKAHVNYRISKGDLPSGRLTPTGGKREFTLGEASPSLSFGTTTSNRINHLERFRGAYGTTFV